MKKRWRLLAATMAVCASLVGVAQAAQWNSISGQASGTSWYTSSTNRHITTPNDTVQIQLDSAPSGGLYWNLINANNGQVFTSTKTVYGNSVVVTLATNVASGTVFHNHYKGVYNGGNFNGQEWY
jgi:hypothetical protein